MIRNNLVWLFWGLWFTTACGSGVVAGQPAEEKAAAAPTTQPAPAAPVVESPRASAHATFNNFMELYRSNDPESTQAMVAYLDLGLLDEDGRADSATLAQRLAEFMQDRKIATRAKYKELKQNRDAGLTEFCLFQEREPVAEGAAETQPNETGDAAAEPRSVCKIKLVQQVDGDGLWVFDAETVRGITLLAARKDLAAAPAPAAEPSVQPVAGDVAPAVVSHRRVWPRYASPQMTMRTFLAALTRDKGKKPDAEAAAACLNLDDFGLRPGDRQSRAMANALLFVLDRSVYVQLLDLPDGSEGKSPYLYRVIRKRWPIEIERVPDGRWLFSDKTLGSLKEMCRGVAADASRVPNAPELSFTKTPELWLFLRLPGWAQRDASGLEVWQWVGLLAVFLAGLFCSRLAQVVLRRISRLVVRRMHEKADAKLESGALRPIGYVVLGYVWLEFFQWLWLPKTLGNILTNASSFVVVIATIWATYRIIDLVCGYAAMLANRSASKFDVLLVPFARKISKVIVTIAGIVYFSDRLFPDRLGAILGGLGLGGLAFALAAQDTLKNIFGSITVMLDRPFEIGDSVKIGDVEGTVESVGFRSTRIRTFYHSQINVPNGKLIDAIVDNMGRRRYRRIRCKLGLTYDTPPEKIEAFCEGVRELIRRHPYTRKDYYQVYFNSFGPSSLEILLYCFIETPDWSIELRERHRLFCDILQLASRLDVSFAFPTQTLHLHKGDDTPSVTLDMPPAGEHLAPDMIGRSEAAAIAQITVPPAEALGPVKIAQDPQPVDEAYVKDRLSGNGK